MDIQWSQRTEHDTEIINRVSSIKWKNILYREINIKSLNPYGNNLQLIRNFNQIIFLTMDNFW